MINWVAVVVAIVANFVIGFVWYAKWFPTGKVWFREMGVPMDAKPTGAEMAKGLVLMLVGAFLVMFVMATVFLAFTAYYGTTLQVTDGLYGGFFVWLGFFLPVQLGGLAWEKKSVSYVAVNAGYWLVTLLVAGMILAAMPK